MQEYICFIDESSYHNLNRDTLDNTYNIFVLCAVIFKIEDYRKFDKKFRKIKSELFDDEKFIIHTLEITRPNKAKDIKNLRFNNSDFRKIFYNKINALIQESNFSIVYWAIKKSEFQSKYWINSADPYMFCFENLINRIMRLSWWGFCNIYPEKRWHVEDILLETEMLKLKTTWSSFYSWIEIQDRIQSMVLKSKNTNDSGLQLADLVVSPIGRHILWKQNRINSEVLYNIIKTKMPRWWNTIFP